MSILYGNCLQLLPQIEPETVQLIYLDPPFFTQKEHSSRPRDNSQEYRFTDKWPSLADYLMFMRELLTQCHRLLKKEGNLFLQCDKSASHHLRLLLDEIFGWQNFQSEIIWSYKRWSNSKKGLLNNHQTIYFYSKTADFKFNTLYTAYSPTTNVDQILQARAKNEFGKSIYNRHPNGDVILGPEKKGVPLSDVWNIPFLNPKAKERVGYPTQKPILLLEQILMIGSDKGDLILDPFCGSGTTLVAAKLLDRLYLGIDLSQEAIQLTEKRLTQLIKTNSALLERGEEHYLEKSEIERDILRALQAVPVERNSGIDGFLKNYVDNRPVAIRIQKPGEDLEVAQQKLIQAGRVKNCHFLILIRTHKNSERLFLSSNIPENILLIDAYDLLIQEWLTQQTHNQHNEAV